MTEQALSTSGRSVRAVWAAGLAVAGGAAVATAHGLYEVARAAGAPTPIAALYPLITDGLALVAYACTTRLYGRGLSYAWTIVVLAAGLSGLAQAAYLAGGVNTAPTWLAFGVGAWPATAAAIVAHLLHLLAASNAPYNQASNPYDPAVQPYEALYGPYNGNGTPLPDEPADPVPANGDGGAAGARERARAAAVAHRTRLGDLPTVTELMHLAAVARGTAAAALKQLRTEPVNGSPRTDR